MGIIQLQKLSHNSTPSNNTYNENTFNITPKLLNVSNCTECKNKQETAMFNSAITDPEGNFLTATITIRLLTNTRGPRGTF